MSQNNAISAKKKVLLALKEKLEAELKYYENNIQDLRTNVKNVSYYHEDSCDSDDDFVVPFDTCASIPVLKLQQDKLKTCLQATQELTNLIVLQSEVNVMVENPVIKGEKPVWEPGTWHEVTAECRIDLVPFSITFYKHTPYRKFGAQTYRGLQVALVKKSHETELEKSVLHTLKKPSDAVEVLRSYANAYRERRTTLAKLANRYAKSLFMESQPQGFLLKCADLLEITWRLENKWSPVAPFHHRMKFDLEYMDEAYVKIVTQAHKQLLNPSIQVDERTLLLAKIITTCLEAKGTVEPESDLESQNTEKDSETHKKDIEIMAPPKCVPKKSKKRSLDDENNEQAKKLKVNNTNKNNGLGDKIKTNDNKCEDGVKKQPTQSTTVKRTNTVKSTNAIPVKKSKTDKTGENDDSIKGKGSKSTKEIDNNVKNNENNTNSTKVRPVNKDGNTEDKNQETKKDKTTKESTNVNYGKPRTKKDINIATAKKARDNEIDKLDNVTNKDIEHPQSNITDKKKDKVATEDTTKSIKPKINNKKLGPNTKTSNSENKNLEKNKNKTTTESNKLTTTNKANINNNEAGNPEKKKATSTKESTNVQGGKSQTKKDSKKKKNTDTAKTKRDTETDEINNISKNDVERPQKDKVVDKAHGKKTDVTSNKTDNKSKENKENNAITTKNNNQTEALEDTSNKNKKENVKTNHQDGEDNQITEKPSAKIKNKTQTKPDKEKGASTNFKNQKTVIKEAGHTKEDNSKKKTKPNSAGTTKPDNQTLNKATEKNIMNTKPKEKISEIKKTVSETNLKSKTTNLVNKETKNPADEINTEIRKTVSESNLKNQPSTSDAKSKQPTIQNKIEKTNQNKENLTKTNNQAPKKNLNNILQAEKVGNTDKDAKNPVKTLTHTNKLTKPPFKTIKDSLKNIPSHRNSLKTHNPQKTTMKPCNPKISSGNTQKANGGQKIISKIPQKKISDRRDSLKNNFLRVSPRKLAMSVKGATQRSLTKQKAMKITNIPRLQKKTSPHQNGM